MASTKPRFGGARNMEFAYHIKDREDKTNQTDPDYFEMEKGERETDTKETTVDQSRPPNMAQTSEFGYSLTQQRTVSPENNKGVSKPVNNQRKGTVESLLPAPEKEAGERQGQHENILYCQMEGQVSSDVPKEEIFKKFEITASSEVSTCHRSDGHLQQLLVVLEELGISAKPVPYTRLRNQSMKFEENATLKKSLNFSGDSGSTGQRTQPMPLTAPCSPTGKRGLESCDSPSVSYANENDVIYCKNLFLKDRKGQYYVIIVEENDSVDLKELKNQLSAHRNLSFADENSLRSILQLKPGAVTPLALMHGTAKDVRVAVYRQLTERAPETKFAFHPLDATMQIELTLSELRGFVEKFGNTLEVLFAMEGNKSEKAFSVSTVKSHRKSTASTSPKKSVKQRYVEVEFADNSKIKFSEASLEPKINHEQNCNKTEKELGDLPSSTNHFRMVKPAKNVVRKEDKSTPAAASSNSTAILKESEAVPSNVNLEEPERPETISDDSPSLHKTKKTESANSETDFPLAEVAPMPARSHRQRMPLYDRKGKLKSYLKKTSNTRANASNNNPDLETNLNDSTNFTTSTIPTLNTEENELLPEVLQFYQTLKIMNVAYKEVDLANSDVGTMGPSIGCRCFLLRDTRNSFYFIVTHEFYELDFGRLKKALKPKKKILRTDVEEMLSVMGVDPSRVTPFAYLNRRHENIRIFFTEKIMSDPLVLCIQHPFAYGHRIVIKSSELRRLLSHFEAEVERVEEKHWPPRYNIIFSQFEVPNERSKPSKDTLNSTQQQATEDSGKPSSVVSDVVGKVCSFIYRSVVSGRNVTQGSSNDPTGRGNFLESSVDPSENDVTIDQVNVATPQNQTPSAYSHFPKHGQSAAMPSKSGMPEDMSNAFSSNEDTDGDDDDEDDNQKVKKTKHQRANPDAQRIGKETTSITPEDIFDHLKVHNVSFNRKRSTESMNRDKLTDEQGRLGWDPVNAEKDKRITQTDEKRQCTDNRTMDESQRQKQKQQREGNSLQDVLGNNGQFEVNSRPIKNQIIVRNSNGTNDNSDDSDGEDDLEICTMTHLEAEDGTVYIVIGGESDAFSIKRFCRRFNIRKVRVIYDSFFPEFLRHKLKGPRPSPFSVAIMNENRLNLADKSMKIVLTTSIYISSTTTLRFDLDAEGTNSIKMTSAEFEEYARRVGFDIWYMP